MSRINMSHALDSPTPEELRVLLSTLCATGLWKLGQCFGDLLDTRPFHTCHYDPTYFNSSGALCVARGLTDTASAAALETAGIQHLKFELRVGVNVRSYESDVSHDGYSSSRPGALYIVPVQPRFTTQQHFWEKHKSRYKMTKGGAGLREQRRAAGQPPHGPHKPHKPHGPHKPHKPNKPHTPSTADGRKHDGGKQPKRKVHMHDEDFVSLLIDCGIPLDQLDRAFVYTSNSNFNKLLDNFWKVPEVALKLSRLFGGTHIRDCKFKRIKPIFLRAREKSKSMQGTLDSFFSAAPRKPAAGLSLGGKKGANKAGAFGKSTGVTKTKKSGGIRLG